MNPEETIDFIGIGAGTCGSTWVARCLSEHPDILFSSEKSKKELDFFTSALVLYTHYSRCSEGVEWYLDQFLTPSAARFVTPADRSTL